MEFCQNFLSCKFCSKLLNTLSRDLKVILLHFCFFKLLLINFPKCRNAAQVITCEPANVMFIIPSISHQGLGPWGSSSRRNVGTPPNLGSVYRRNNGRSPSSSPLSAAAIRFRGRAICHSLLQMSPSITLKLFIKVKVEER